MIRKGSFLSRLAALLLLLAAVFLFELIAVEPVLDAHRSYDELIAASRTQLQRFMTHRKNVDGLKLRLTVLRREASAPAQFLKAKSSALVSAHLLSHLKREILAQRGTLKSTQVLPKRESGLFPRIAARVEMRVTPEAFKKILYRLESALPVLFIDNVLITGRTIKRTTNHGGKNRQVWDELTLDVRFDVYGYVWVGLQS